MQIHFACLVGRAMLWPVTAGKLLKNLPEAVSRPGLKAAAPKAYRTGVFSNLT